MNQKSIVSHTPKRLYRRYKEVAPEWAHRVGIFILEYVNEMEYLMNREKIKTYKERTFENYSSWK